MVKRKRASGMGDTAQQHVSSLLTGSHIPSNSVGNGSEQPHGAITPIDWNTQATVVFPTTTPALNPARQPITLPDRALLSPTLASAAPSPLQLSPPPSLITQSSMLSSPPATSIASPSSSLEAELAKVVICPICLSSFDERVYLSPCFHSYCAACLDAWVAVSVSCPLCKTRPDKLHYGVDTRRRLLQTIYISRPSTSSSTLSWQDQLRRLALQSQQSLGSAANTIPPSSVSSPSPSTSPSSGVAMMQTVNDGYGADEALIPEDSPLRSRSPTPIDTSNTGTFDYDAQPFFMTSRQPTADTGNPPLPSPQTTATVATDLAILTETFPAAPLVVSHIENLLCSVVQATAPQSSSTRRQQALQLRTATAMTTATHTTTLGSKTNEAQWHQVADQIAEWITFSTVTTSTMADIATSASTTVALSPLSLPRPPHATDDGQMGTDQEEGAASTAMAGVLSLGPRSAQELAQQFVDEMRRVARRHLSVRPWDAQVLYGASPYHTH
ncbi:hypothetical protein BGZ73_000898 [Actinomortierella ambigua]|nr:hypothetical protein BGZ73_000898 [Actinomortierella ambigua]